MKKSEKILVVMVGVAILYGLADFTLSQQKKKDEARDSSPSTAQASAELTAQLGAVASASDQKIDQLTTTLLVDSWPAQVFALRTVDFVTDTKLEEEKAALYKDLQAKAQTLVYSGFVAMGGERMAILNDMDYRVGDMVEGFTVASISQDKVQVRLREDLFDIPAITEEQAAAKAPNTNTKVNIKSH